MEGLHSSGGFGSVFGGLGEFQRVMKRFGALRKVRGCFGEFWKVSEGCRVPERFQAFGGFWSVLETLIPINGRNCRPLILEF